MSDIQMRMSTLILIAMGLGGLVGWGVTRSYYKDYVKDLEESTRRMVSKDIERAAEIIQRIDVSKVEEATGEPESPPDDDDILDDPVEEEDAKSTDLLTEAEFDELYHKPMEDPAFEGTEHIYQINWRDAGEGVFETERLWFFLDDAVMMDELGDGPGVNYAVGDTVEEYLQNNRFEHTVIVRNELCETDFIITSVVASYSDMIRGSIPDPRESHDGEFEL